MFSTTFRSKPKKNMLFSTLQGSNANIKWVKNENLHLTLKFIGHTREKDIPKIIDAVNDVTINHKPFILKATGTGCFPKKERLQNSLYACRREIKFIKSLI